MYFISSLLFLLGSVIYCFEIKNKDNEDKKTHLKIQNKKTFQNYHKNIFILYYLFYQILQSMIKYNSIY